MSDSNGLVKIWFDFMYIFIFNAYYKINTRAVGWTIKEHEYYVCFCASSLQDFNNTVIFYIDILNSKEVKLMM